MRVWKYEATEPNKSTPFEDGYVIAEDFDEATKKIKEHLKEAWDFKLELTKLEYEHDIQIS